MEADAKITEKHRLATAMGIINYEGKSIAVAGTDQGEHRIYRMARSYINVTSTNTMYLLRQGYSQHYRNLISLKPFSRFQFWIAIHVFLLFVTVDFIFVTTVKIYIILILFNLIHFISLLFEDGILFLHIYFG